MVSTAKIEQALEIEAEIIEPAVPLYQYQIDWMLDESRFKYGLWSRQAGKSFASCLVAVDDCCINRTNWVFLSAGERQSKNLMQTAQLHAMAYGAVCEILESDFIIEEKKFKKLEINFPNKSKMIGLPANPATARGHSAHVVLDEFAHHRDSREIWGALFPTITRGYKIRVISTPLGKKNKFYELWSNPRYSKYKVTILDAVEQGLELIDEDGNPCSPEDLREALCDDEYWQQEFMVEFLDESTAFLTYDLITSCQDGTIDPYPDWIGLLLARAKAHYQEYKTTGKEIAWDASDIMKHCRFNEIYAGYDVARKRDFSVIWVDDLIEGKMRCAAIVNLIKEPFFIQKRVLWSILDHPKFKRCCIDSTGMGMQMAEETKDKFHSKAEAIDFTIANKESMAQTTKRSLEEKNSEVPVDRIIRESFHSVKKYPTPTGHFRFDADRTADTGHADHFWAKALCLQARGVNSVAAAASGDDPEDRPTITGHRPGRMFGGIRVRVNRHTQGQEEEFY